MRDKITIKLTSRPISKKNSKRWLMRGRRPFLIPSEAYTKFEKEALNEIRGQIPIGFETFNEQVFVDYKFQIKGNYHVDVDNLVSGINDILQKAGIILDDDLITGGAFLKGKGDEWLTEVIVSNVKGVLT